MTTSICTVLVDVAISPLAVQLMEAKEEVAQAQADGEAQESAREAEMVSLRSQLSALSENEAAAEMYKVRPAATRAPPQSSHTAVEKQ
eukprot:scaffold50901_cov18-Prasinocladus_malaysianus.AAC.1